MDDTAVSDPVNLREFLAQWREVTTDYDLNRDIVANVQEYAIGEMGITSEMIAELEVECTPETLSSESDPKDNLTLLCEIPEDADLETLKEQKVELRQRKIDTVYKNKVLDKMKYRGRVGPWKHRVFNRESLPDAPTAAFPDVILTVQIYRPYCRKRTLTLDQEFEVLGSQLLTELRQKIYCMADYVQIGDFSQNPDHPGDIMAKDIYQSGFFFIESTFYNDLHNETCRDYSRVIMEWSRAENHGVSPYQCDRMETTRFIDLTIRLGQPYLYMHQGDCEHLLIFSDVRISHVDDCNYLDKYPLLTYKSRERKPKCRVCQQHLASELLVGKRVEKDQKEKADRTSATSVSGASSKQIHKPVYGWVTYGSTLTPEDPCFFCDTCFRALHFDNEDKMIVSNVTIYPYPDSRIMAFTGSQ